MKFLNDFIFFFKFFKKNKCQEEKNCENSYKTLN